MPEVTPHTAKSLIFTCIDERLEDSIETFIHAIPGGAFHVAIAGGGAAFIDEIDARVAVKQVVAAYLINRVTNVYLQSHTNCGAYRLEGITFDSSISEIYRLYADLDHAQELITAALIRAGAGIEELHINTTVVDVQGNLIPRPVLTASSQER